MEPTMISAALQTVVTNVTAMATNAAPIVLGIVGVLAGINVGLGIFKRFVGKIN